MVVGKNAAGLFCFVIYFRYISYLNFINMATTKNNSRKTSKKMTPKTTYTSVGPNIYFDGTSYRVRVIKDGTRYSKNLGSKRAAVQFRNQILGK